jgi:putative cell wall-binding protein
MPAARRILTAVALSVALSLVAGLPPASAAIGALPAPGETGLVSVGTTGAPGDDSSTQTSVSADGRFVAFTSSARNLSVLPVATSQSQVYVRDVASGQTSLVSVNAAGTGGGNYSSFDPSISDDGRFVAFASQATDIDASVAAGGHVQVYLRDLTAGSTQLVSRNPSTRAAGVESSYSPSLSGDGSRVVFVSLATNLLPGTIVERSQIFGAEMKSGVMSVVRVLSVRDATLSSPGEVGNGDSSAPSLSRDGTVVAFESRSTNLTSNVVPGMISQIYLHSSVTGSTGLVSVTPDGSGGGNGDSRRPVVSADGRRIAYDSKAGNLSPRSTGNLEQVYIRDTAALASELVSVNQFGAKAANGPSRSASLSDDGQRVAFTSDAGDVVRGDNRRVAQVYWRDLRLSLTNLVSATAGDPRVGGGGSGAGNADVSGDGRLVAFSAARDLLGGAEAEPSQIYLQGLEAQRIERMGGADRFAVSARISAETFAPGVDVAYVASGSAFPDALSGSAAAGSRGAPVLLVGADSIPTVIGGELARLKPKRIVVLGGTAAVSSTVETALRGYSPIVDRLGGADRFVVSAAVSKDAFSPGTPVAYIASGTNFPDALSGSAIAAKDHAPVLLVTKDSIPSAITEELKRLNPGRIVILGGTSAISTTVETTLGAMHPTTRIAGADRFVVSAAASAAAFPTGAKTVFIASGVTFPDALSGSPAAAANSGPVLLVTPTTIPASVATELDRLNPTQIVVLGGTAAIFNTVYQQLKGHLH